MGASPAVGDYNNHQKLTQQQHVQLQKYAEKFENKAIQIKRNLKSANNEEFEHRHLKKDTVQLIQIKENIYKNQLNEHIRAMPCCHRHKFNNLLRDNYNNYIPSVSNINQYNDNEIITIITDIIDNINKCNTNIQNEIAINSYNSMCANNWYEEIYTVMNGVQTRSMTKKK